MKVAITGANGFIGGSLAKRLAQSGCGVVALTRNPLPPASALRCEYLHYSLVDGLSSHLPDDCDTIIHCAYSAMPGGKGDVDLNIGAVKALQSEAAGRRIVFISSMSAHEGAVSAYGRGKWAIEGMLGRDTDLVIKPGFVIGPGGIFERLRGSIRRLPVVPLFYGGNQPIQTIWVNDLAEGIGRAVERRLTGTLTLGSEESVTLRDFYLAIMASENLRRPLVPAPGGLSLGALRLLEGMGVDLPLSSENLLGLQALRHFETKPSLDLLGLSLVDLPEALRRTKAAEPSPKS
jgi:nucleoside-diphosphate-sugar epimerase